MMLGFMAWMVSLCSTFLCSYIPDFACCQWQYHKHKSGQGLDQKMHEEPKMALSEIWSSD